MKITTLPKVAHVVCSPCSEPFSIMLPQEFSHIPSLPHHAHVSERAKATLGVAQASDVTCIY